MLGNILHDQAEIEGLVERRVGDEVERCVKEREKPQHSAPANEGAPPGELSNRGDCEGQQKESEGPVSGSQFERFDGVCAQRIGECSSNQQHEWQQREEEHDWLERTYGAHVRRSTRTRHSLGAGGGTHWQIFAGAITTLAQ